jgi:hypothetical protein
METPLRETVAELLEPAMGPCVSLYAPLHPASAEARQDPIRLKNLRNAATEQLTHFGLSTKQSQQLLQPLDVFFDGERPRPEHGRGVAVFLAPGIERTFFLASDVAEALFVDEQFHLRPLLPFLAEQDRFFVLALSQNAVRLLEGWSGGLVVREFDGLHSFDQTTAVNHLERGDKVHEGPASSRDRLAAATKGPGKSTADLRHFVREVAAAIDRRLHGQAAPLVLAAVDSMAQLWRQVSRYPHTIDALIQGNADYLSSAELHEKAWPLVQPVLEQERHAAAKRLRSGDNQPRYALDLPNVVAAAMHGRVDTLFVDCSQPRWGRVDPANGSVEVHDRKQPGDADLIEVAATETLRRDGHVFPLRPDNGSPSAAAEALLRY